MERINCLWTGGLDSTYTVAYFSRFEVEIQPYYLVDKHRGSKDYEMNAIKEITEIIRNHKETKATILPLITKPIEDIKKDAEISAAYKRIREQSGIGSQYDWLARFAKEENLEELYVSFVLSPNARGRSAVAKLGYVEEHNRNGYTYYAINKEKSDRDTNLLFGRMHFPMSWNTPKKDEYRILKEMGLEEVAKKVWYCFNPINGEKCGTCNPCRFYIKDGFADTFTKEALERYEKFERTPHWVHQLRDYKNLALIKLGLK